MASLPQVMRVLVRKHPELGKQRKPSPQHSDSTSLGLQVSNQSTV